MNMLNINQRENRRMMDLPIMHLFLFDKATKTLAPPSCLPRELDEK